MGHTFALQDIVGKKNLVVLFIDQKWPEMLIVGICLFDTLQYQVLRIKYKCVRVCWKNQKLVILRLVIFSYNFLRLPIKNILIV